VNLKLAERFQDDQQERWAAIRRNLMTLTSGSRCKANDAMFPSGVVVGCGKDEAQCVSAGWCQEGHPARKTSHRNP